MGDGDWKIVAGGWRMADDWWAVSRWFPGMERTAAGEPVGADGRQGAAGRNRQRKEFIHDAQDQCHPVDHAEFAVDTIDVSVDGVGRDAEVDGDGELSVVVENAAQDLQFA